MRSYKKVFAIIMTIFIINSSIMISVFGASKSAGDICASLGVLKGGSNGVDAAYLAMPTQRIQAAIIHLRMLGLEDEAKAYKGTDNFTDAGLVANISGATNILAYLKANPNLGWMGDGKKFSPLDNVSAQQFYKVLLTILGYSQGTDFEYKDAIVFAKFKGMGSISKAVKMTNGDMATALVEALGTTLKGGTPSYTLISKLVKSGRISESAASANGFVVSTAKIVSVAAPADKSIDSGSNLSLPSTVKATLSDGKTSDVAVAWDMSSFNANKSGDYIIPGKITGYDPGVSVKVTVKALIFDVSSASVMNLRQILVSFNNPITNTTEAVKASNYSINGAVPVDASLSQDKKSVTLTTYTNDYMINYSTNNKVVIKKEVGLSADKTIVNLIAKDTDIPKVVSVDTMGPLNLTVNFSEPLDDRVNNYFTAGSFVIDDNKIGIDTTNVTYSKTSTAINLRMSYPLAVGAHTLKIKSPSEGGFIKDSAGYNVESTTVSFTLTQDTTALTASVTDVKEMSMKIKFNKVLKAGSFAGNSAVLISHTYQGRNQITGASVLSADNQEFTITFLNPLPPGTSTVWLDYADSTADSKKIQDNYGNIFAPTKFQVNVIADTTKPTVTAEFMNPKQIKVTFSKTVNSIFNDAGSAINYANYVLKDSQGTTIQWLSGTPSILNAGTVFALNTKTDINGGTLTLTVKNIKDTSVAQNKIDDTTLTINATDMIPPTLDATAPLVKISDTKVRINFSEAIDAATLGDKTNYKIGFDESHTKSLVDNDTITLINSNKSILITFNTAPLASDHIFVGRIKDTSGNSSSWLSKDAGQIGSAAADIIPSAVDVVAGDKIRITINDQISSVGSIHDYMYKIGDAGTWNNVAAISSVNVDVANNKTYIELAMLTDIGNNTALIVPVYVSTYDGTVIGNASPNVKNALGQKLIISPLTPCADKLPPKYVSVATGAVSGGKLKTVILTFSESLYVPSVEDTDFKVDGFEVESVSVSFFQVTITLKDKANSSGEKPKVTLVGSVDDQTRNTLTGPADNTCP